MWLDPVLVGLNIVSIVLLIILTLNSEAPLKRVIVNSGYITMLYQGWSWCVIFVVKLLLYQVFSYFYYTSRIPNILEYLFDRNKMAMMFPDATRIAEEEVDSIAWRMHQCMLFVVFSMGIKYILQLIVTNETTEALKQYQLKSKYSYIFDALTGEYVFQPGRVLDSLSGANGDAIELGDKLLSRNRADKFNAFEESIMRYQLETWKPWPSEVMEFTRLYQLFANVHVSGIQNIPSDTPSLIITNHALGHG
ncbi:hypothetical protein RFI_05479 [Reticulomyxa filosa]|uniref:Uncharacterized protein n=1 Tax=Reticulomyxa filosa TaxID=46433 RepID=X6P0I1_RETFI|nr:hypothetical protein RFI_05479 [Reticulomyxa filosa]|eukprot:ETO31643.1 hypothetical protein RFI_05479 [Reticulomyxa filosa]